MTSHPPRHRGFHHRAPAAEVVEQPPVQAYQPAPGEWVWDPHIGTYIWLPAGSELVYPRQRGALHNVARALVRLAVFWTVIAAIVLGLVAGLAFVVFTGLASIGRSFEENPTPPPVETTTTLG